MQREMYEIEETNPFKVFDVKDAWTKVTGNLKKFEDTALWDLTHHRHVYIDNLDKV